MLIEYILKSSLLDRSRKLILNEDYLEYENKDLKSDLFSRLNKSDIIDFKHEFEHLIFYKFPIGKKFSITFLAKDKNELSVKFKEYFWNNFNYTKVYSELINKIWQYYFIDIVNSHHEKFQKENQLTFRILQITRTGLILNSNKILIPWKNLEFKEYPTYFVVFNQLKPKEFQRMGFNEWNSELMFSLIRTIKNTKK